MSDSATKPQQIIDSASFRTADGRYGVHLRTRLWRASRGLTERDDPLAVQQVAHTILRIGQAVEVGSPRRCILCQSPLDAPGKLGAIVIACASHDPVSAFSTLVCDRCEPQHDDDALPRRVLTKLLDVEFESLTEGRA